MICDFKFRWCAPCKGLTSRLDAIIGEKDGLLELAKVDVDINPELAMEYEVSIDLALGHTLFLGRSIFGHFTVYLILDKINFGLKFRTRT